MYFSSPPSGFSANRLSITTGPSSSERERSRSSRNPSALSCSASLGTATAEDPIDFGSTGVRVVAGCIQATTGVGNAPADPTEPLLDEEDLRVLRQRPEVVGDDQLEGVGDLADLVHLRELVVAGVLGQLEALDAVGVDVGRLELADPGDELLDQRLQLGFEAADPGRADLARVADRRGQQHRLRDRAARSRPRCSR